MKDRLLRKKYMGAVHDQNDHSQVPQHCEQVDSKEQEEQGQLQLWLIC